MSEPNQTQNTQSADLEKDGVDVITGIREENEFDNTPTETVEEKSSAPNTTPLPSATKPATFVATETQVMSEKEKIIPPINTPVATNQQKTQETAIPRTQNDPSTKAIRTFRLDASEAMHDQKTSMVKMVVAEQKRKEDRGEVTGGGEKTKKPLIIGICLLLAILVISVGGYFVYPYIASNGSGPTKNTTGGNTNALLSYTKIIEISPKEDSTLFEDIANRTKTLTGTVESITSYNIVDSETKKKISIEEVLQNSTINSPENFIRSLAPEYMFGVYFSEGNTPFIILKNTFFQNAFSGMLVWEDRMEEDFRPLINIEHPGPKILEKTFTDTMIKNKQVRILKDTKGNELLFYTFTDQNTLLITTNRKTLEALIAKLTVVKVIR